MQLSTTFLPVFRRGFTEMSFEGLRKCEGITITNIICHLIYAQGLIGQKLNSHLHAISQKIILKRIAGGVLEKAGEITSVKTKGQSNLVYFYWLSILKAYVRNDVLNI